MLLDIKVVVEFEFVEVDTHLVSRRWAQSISLTAEMRFFFFNRNAPSCVRKYKTGFYWCLNR